MQRIRVHSSNFRPKISLFLLIIALQPSQNRLREIALSFCFGGGGRELQGLLGGPAESDRSVALVDAVGLLDGWEVLGGGYRGVAAVLAVDLDEAPAERGHGLVVLGGLGWG